MCVFTLVGVGTNRNGRCRYSCQTGQKRTLTLPSPFPVLRITFQTVCVYSIHVQSASPRPIPSSHTQTIRHLHQIRKRSMDEERGEERGGGSEWTWRTRAIRQRRPIYRKGRPTKAPPRVVSRLRVNSKSMISSGRNN